ncbi:hypothetical protein [Glycomyces xiaoerkulensis]|uniref:hypothetical protein n=1 Tax=Glycomyces xiaoerkulensis TaxID=2038139 RepID=UPI000C261273|nr:hypothetical protein [Glycomyces xiaoerkulensis]
MAFDGVWELRRGSEVLGEIHVNDGEFPWLMGRFVPRPGFAEVKPLFDRSLELLHHDDGAQEGWEEVYDRIVETLTLVAPDGPVSDFLLHIKDGEAWFRWCDEPSGDR